MGEPGMGESIVGSTVGSTEFADAARRLGPVIREHGWLVPTFRSPPRIPGQNRSIRRRTDGSATVAVALRGRSLMAVLADMIDGVVVANVLGGDQASQLREDLWNAAGPMLGVPVTDSRAESGSTPARSGATIHQLRPVASMSEAA